MNIEQARAALNYNEKCPEIIVQTRSGAQYAVAWDILEESDDGYVYGYRVNGRCGPIGRGEMNGAIRWFDLKNVTLVEGESK